MSNRHWMWIFGDSYAGFHHRERQWGSLYIESPSGVWGTHALFDEMVLNRDSMCDKERDEEGMMVIPRALTIAGSDSGGGAGLQADLKTFAAFGVYGMSVVTAVTVQNTRGVYGVVNMDPDVVAKQIRVVVEDLGIDVVKTGMLATAEIIRRVAELTRAYRFPVLVVDPVMRAKSGDPLLEAEAESAYIKELIPLATVVTPNLPEAERLVGFRIRTDAAMERAAERIIEFGCGAVVVKGGHREDLPDAVADLYFDGEQMVWLRGPRLPTRHTHGTGCTFASAVAAGLARGWDRLTAVRTAKAYVEGAIRHAPGLGQGHGPLNHFWSGRIPFEPIRTSD